MPRIGYSPRRARLGTSKPKFAVEPLPQVYSSGQPVRHEHTRQFEQQTIENIEFEFEGLSLDQRDCVLQTLYQTQVVRDKYQTTLDGTLYLEDEDEEILEFMEQLSFPIDDSIKSTGKMSSSSSPALETPDTKSLSLYKPKPKYYAGNVVDPSSETFVVAGNGIHFANSGRGTSQ